MKRTLLLLIAVFAIANYSFAQPGNNNSGQGFNQWKTNGNNADSTQFLGTSNNASLRFKTNNTEHIRLTSDGKMGVGITIPVEKFDLLGNMRLSGDVIFDGYKDLNETNNRFLFIDKYGRSGFMTKSGLLASMYSSDCFPLTDLNGNILYPAPSWQSEGGPNGGVLFTGETCPARVGIGISNPLTTLHVVGNGYFTSSLGLGAEPVSQYNLYIKNGIKPKGILIDFTDFNGTRTAFEIQHSNPLSKSIFISNTVDNGYFKVSGSGGVEIQFNDIASNNHSDKKSAFTIKDNSGTDVFRIYNDGRIFSTEVSVRIPGQFPDYVFNTAYNLMPLDSVKKFIEQESHLPNVPTAKEVEEEGLNVGEMQVIQMEKIEELTLYLIQMNERLKQMEIENEKLKKQLIEFQMLQEQK